uniref:Uncharacterized protein n=1 Tax=Romanomermis culicivorax TaxID=13658 RepID=A0A915J4W4_ROMCU
MYNNYSHNIVHELPYSVQQSVYLLCKSVQNLLRLAGGPTSAAFTDLLMNLTPCLFADSWNDTKFFLRCNRLLLIMIQNRPQVFLPLPFLDECGDIQWLNDEIKFAEKIFLIASVPGFFDKVHRLENQLSAAESVDSGIGLDEDRSLATNLIEKSTTKKCIDQNLSTPDLYRLTFSIDLEE